MVKVGDKIRCVFMNDVHAVPSGTEGYVTAVHERLGVIEVDWDNGQSLNLVTDEDSYEIVDKFAL